MQPHSNAVIANGKPLAGATVTVRKVSDNALATLYSDNGTTVLSSAGVTTSGANGFFEFFAANERYTVTITATGYQTQAYTIVLDDPESKTNSTDDYVAVGTDGRLLGTDQAIGSLASGAVIWTKNAKYNAGWKSIAAGRATAFGFAPSGTTYFYVSQSAAAANEALTWTGTWSIDPSGHLLPILNNSYDLGIPGTALPRTGYFSTSVVIGSDAILLRDAANILAQRNGTNAQAYRLYNTFTDASNYERGDIKWVANVLSIETEAAGTGTVRQLQIGTQGAAALRLFTDGAYRWDINSAGHFLGVTDNTLDIGAAGATRPRTGYFGTSVVVGAAGWTMSATAGTGLTAQGNARFAHGTSALATTATEGFLHIQSCAGAPTGVPASIPAGQIPVVYDSTNNRIYFYNGAWRSVAVA